MSCALSDNPPSPGADLRARIVALADQCVKCGLCQPQCPTYHVARQEAESPRGRIALAKALAQGVLAASGVASATRHLDQCLACMRCERVCPSQVRYGELIVAARELQRGDGQSRSVIEQKLSAWLKRPRALRFALRLANLPLLRQCIQSSILRGAWGRLGLERTVRELPRLPPRPALRRLAPRAAVRGRVGLFLGCVAASSDRDVHVAARHLLGALGYQVVEPPGQGCCGALALHGGDVAAARGLGEPTRRAFVDARIDTVLVSASGCFGTLRDLTFADGTVRVREIHEFLAADACLAQLAFLPLPQRVALHTPCTQANVARADGAIRALLQRIPQMEIAALPDVPGCCGAAGDYFLRHPDVADALRTEKLDQAAALTPDVLVTSNVGCRIFLANGLRRRGAAARVIHPIVLLAQQLDN